MAISNAGGIQRKQTHPGEMLREDFIPDYGLTVAGLAELLGVSRQSVNELLRERRSVSPEVVGPHSTRPFMASVSCHQGI